MFIQSSHIHDYMVGFFSDTIFIFLCSIPHHIHQAGGVFYDLGSGTGKVVLAAALLHSFSACCGIELLAGLHEVALGYQMSWEQQGQAPSSASSSTSSTTSPARSTTTSSRPSVSTTPTLSAASAASTVSAEDITSDESGVASSSGTTCQTLEYIRGSILDTRTKNWPRDADVVFSNTHCFDAEMMTRLSELAGASMAIIDNVRLYVCMYMCV
jgi:hypothetical protein